MTCATGAAESAWYGNGKQILRSSHIDTSEVPVKITKVYKEKC